MQKTIVLPGYKIADRKLYMPNTYIESEATYAAVIGTMDESGHFIALESRYKPFSGDTVIGVVTDMRGPGYSIYLNSPYTAFVHAKFLRTKLEIGNIIAGKVIDVNEIGDVELEEIMPLPKGKIIEVPPAKVPRIIGRKNSMIDLLIKYAGGDIIVGNNGYVWVNEKSNIPLVIKSIQMIIDKAHTSGLTDAMQAFLENEKS